MKIVSVEQMRSLDQQAIDSGITGETLMERAGRGAVEFIQEWIAQMAPAHRRKITLLAGKGNNGGDAYVAARILAQEEDLKLTVFSVCPINELHGDALLNARRLPESVDLKVRSGKLPPAAFGADTVVVDGLLGTGFKGELKEPYRTIINQVNQSGCPVAALDIPSGLNGDSGRPAQGGAVQADLTITMGLPKTGMFTAAGRRHCGRLRVVDIGLPAKAVKQAESYGQADFQEDIRKLLPRRPNSAHKRTFGRILIAAGSRQYIGAPLLAAQGASVLGAGVVSVAVPAGVWTDTPCPHLPASLIVSQVDSGGHGRFNAVSIPHLQGLLKQSEAVVFGPGVGVDNEAGQVLKALLRQRCPIVVDADGLNLLAASGSEFRTMLEQAVITPHPGEMKRLLWGFGINGDFSESLEEKRSEAAVLLARKTNAVVVLKGQGTVVASPQGEFWISGAGSAALATAGTGDVLAGMIGGLLAQGKSREEAARIGVFIHGLAGEIGMPSERSFTADDLPPAVARALQATTPFA